MNNEDILKIENLKFKDDTYYIRWNITRLCNYYCDFCIQGNRDKHLLDSRDEASIIRNKISNKIIDFIEKKLNNKYKKINIYLIGGEVTILNDFIEILKKIVNVKFNGVIKFYITTNLSCDISLIKSIKSIFYENKNRVLIITASYYKEFTSEKEFINKVKYLYEKNKINYILSKLSKKKILKKNNIYVTVAYPIINDLDYKKYLLFKKKYIFKCNSINYIIIRKYNESISDKLKNKLNRFNYKNIKVTLKDHSVHYFTNNSKLNMAINNTHKFNPYKMKCDSGINSLSIDNIGNVSRCQSCKKQSFVYNILDTDPIFFTEFMECHNSTCDCNYYGTIKNNEGFYEE